MCAKYVAETCWPYEELADHWDELILRCSVVDGVSRTLYQEGTLASILAPGEVIDRLPGIVLPTDEAVAVFSGTIATRSGLVYGERYELELEDPVLQRTITGSYRVKVLAQHV
jgi:hypothetical protein